MVIFCSSKEMSMRIIDDNHDGLGEKECRKKTTFDSNSIVLNNQNLIENSMIMRQMWIYLR